jgi:hypothetical protein
MTTWHFDCIGTIPRSGDPVKSGREKQKTRCPFPVSRFLLPVSRYPLPDPESPRSALLPPPVTRCRLPLLRAGERWRCRTDGRRAQDPARPTQESPGNGNGQRETGNGKQATGNRQRITDNGQRQSRKKRRRSHLRPPSFLTQLREGLVHAAHAARRTTGAGS